MQELHGMNKILIQVVMLQEISIFGKDMLIHCSHVEILRKIYRSFLRDVKLVPVGLKLLLMEVMLDEILKDGLHFLKACLFSND
jgi:hypothetical protein